jgi:hypothetical protein
MKKLLSILAVLVLVGLLALGRHFYSGETVPAGQPPLVSLTSTNFDQLRAAFNAHLMRIWRSAYRSTAFSDVTNMSAGVFRS